MAALRFEADETAAFMQQAVHSPVDRETVSLLAKRSEGWVAALRFAALAMNMSGGARAGTPSMPEVVIGSRLIMEYLLNEVLARLPLAMQAFLLQTAILRRLNGSLCDALTAQGDAARRLCGGAAHAGGHRRLLLRQRSGHLAAGMFIRLAGMEGNTIGSATSAAGSAGIVGHRSRRNQRISSPIHQAAAEISAVAGMVSTHAQTIPPATVQRTFLTPPVAPTPMTAVATGEYVDGKPVYRLPAVNVTVSRKAELAKMAQEEEAVASAAPRR